MCGIVGVVGDEGVNVGSNIYRRMIALQHRGEESVGIVTRKTSGGKFYIKKGMGALSKVFVDEDSLKAMKGNIGAGHNRYSTTGTNTYDNVQPIVRSFGAKKFFRLFSRGREGFFICHNGNLTDMQEYKDECLKNGYRFNGSTDSEIIAAMIETSRRKDFFDALRDTIERISHSKGAFSLIIVYRDFLIGIRDQYGVRPLCLGEDSESYILASETCVFNPVTERVIMEVRPGEMVVINRKKNSIINEKWAKSVHPMGCVFEFVYFARPDSNIAGINVSLARRNMGKRLAKEQPVKADIVIPVPDSGVDAAEGFAEASGLPYYSHGFFRSHHIGRTFIAPIASERNYLASLKHNPIAAILKGKRVAIVDDSLVRGTTAGKLTEILRIKSIGAKEVHFRIASPVVTSICQDGIDIPTFAELASTDFSSVEEIRKSINCDSLGYLSYDGMISAILDAAPLEVKKLVTHKNFCTGCFNGRYAVKRDLFKAVSAFQ